MSTPYCRHIRTNGRRCCSFAVRGESLCYFHRSVNARMRQLNPPPAANTLSPIDHPLNTIEHRQRDPLIDEYYAGYAPQPGPLALDFPALEDRESIQVALSMLISALGQNRFDQDRARTILYGLQVASANAQHLPTREGTIVTDTIRDESGDELAPDEDPQEVIEQQQFLAELEQELANRDEDEDEDED
jgi:hypothetical protein